MNHAQSPPDAQPGAAQAAFQLNLRHLRGLTAVHEHGSISAAAGAVGLSQPALTQGILKLEKLMGEVLFERRPDGIVPTAAGELVVDRARACLAHLATGTRQVGGTAFEPDRRLSMTQLRAFVALVRAGMGAALVPEAAMSLHFDDVHFRPVRTQPESPVELFAAWRTDNDNPALSAFLDLLRADDASAGMEAGAASD